MEPPQPGSEPAGIPSYGETPRSYPEPVRGGWWALGLFLAVSFGAVALAWWIASLSPGLWTWRAGPILWTPIIPAIVRPPALVAVHLLSGLAAWLVWRRGGSFRKDLGLWTAAGVLPSVATYLEWHHGAAILAVGTLVAYAVVSIVMGFQFQRRSPVAGPILIPQALLYLGIAWDTHQFYRAFY